MKKPEAGHIFINGIVAARDLKPYIQMDVDGKIVQLSLSDARQIANDLILACSRIEVDAMLIEFLKKRDLENAIGPIMEDFREFRYAIDEDKAERPEGPPSV